MNRSFIVVAAIGLVLGASFLTLGMADEDRHRAWFAPARVDFAPLADPLYRSECGDCHMPYPAGLLPAASWRRIMNGLEDHFGDHAVRIPGVGRWDD